MHDALREHGLVPVSEDIAFIACSTAYRVSFQNAHAAFTGGEDPEYLSRLVENESRVDELQKQYESMREERDALMSDLRSAEERISKLSKNKTSKKGPELPL